MSCNDLDDDTQCNNHRPLRLPMEIRGIFPLRALILRQTQCGGTNSRGRLGKQRTTWQSWKAVDAGLLLPACRAGWDTVRPARSCALGRGLRGPGWCWVCRPGWPDGQLGAETAVLGSVAFWHLLGKEAVGDIVISTPLSGLQPSEPQRPEEAAPARSPCI